jgi:hypothetical protein
MLEAIVREIEGRCTATPRRQTMDGLLRGLVAFLEAQRL